MSEHQAVEARDCAACGGKPQWDPARQVLACPFCGVEAQATVDPQSGQIREHDLLRALRELPDERRGLGTERRSVQCRSCRAISMFEPQRVGQTCEFCGSPELIPHEQLRAPVRPESLLPFRVDRNVVRDRLRAWFGSRWFAPGALRRRAMIDTVHGVYVPYWTFDAHAVCPWTAESGTYYYTTETVRNSSGRRETRRVRHVRWSAAAGEVRRFFDDQPVPGTRGVDRALLAAIEPFPTGELVPYEPRYLAGFVVEQYQIVLVDAYSKARESIEQRLRELCAAEVPGDTQRNLAIHPSYSGQTFKLTLGPLWLLTYRFGASAYQVVANGYTGKLAGRYPKSVWKILLLVLAALAAAALAAWIAAR